MAGWELQLPVYSVFRNCFSMSTTQEKWKYQVGKYLNVGGMEILAIANVSESIVTKN